MSLVKGQRNAGLINDLGEDSALLRQSNREFVDKVHSRYCRVVSFYDTKDSRVIEV